MRDYDWANFRPHFDADGDNTAQTILAVNGCLSKIEIANPNVEDAFIQIYDETGTITVGTTVPKQSIHVPGGGAGFYGSKIVSYGQPGLPFQNSIKYACTTTPGGAIDPTVGLTVSAIYYNPER